jgi:hypothetical protein
MILGTSHEIGHNLGSLPFISLVASSLVIFDGFALILTLVLQAPAMTVERRRRLPAL